MPETGATGTPREPAGTLLVVVGPSGVGKDRLIDHARRKLSGDPSVLFVRRTITRTAIAADEDHDHLSPEDFAVALAAGKFAVTWDAHGLRYGIPSSVREHLAQGGVAVINGSRAALSATCSAFGKVVVIHVTARPEILAARLAGRRRESEADISLRLQRAAIGLPDWVERIEIDNSGPFEVAAVAFLETIRRVARVAKTGARPGSVHQEQPTTR